MSGRDRIYVRVTPQASGSKIVVEDGAAEEGAPLYKVYVTVAPEDGKANKAVIKLLAKHFGVAKSSLVIVRGETGRHKVIEILT